MCNKGYDRKCLLKKLKTLVCQIADDSPCPGLVGPIIEIYDPSPKPCVPICNPPPPCYVPACPPCPPPACPASSSQPCPVKMSCPKDTKVVGCLPICKAAPPPCVPVQLPKQEQPCVPCYPPQMMVCYRMPKPPCPKVKKCKSRELRAGIMYVGCDCEKRNGLQDNCPRWQCQGAPLCLSIPPCCCPSQYSGGKHIRIPKVKSKSFEQYQCYPAYVKLPPCPSCAPPCKQSCPPFGPPCVPLVAAPPCPPPIIPKPSCPPPCYPQYCYLPPSCPPLYCSPPGCPPSIPCCVPCIPSPC